MIPFQLHRRIPFVRRPFFQRDEAMRQRDALRVERDALLAEKAGPKTERDALEEQQGCNDFLWLLRRKPLAASFPIDVSSSGLQEPEDLALVARIIAAYRLAHAEHGLSESAWDQSLWELKRHIHERLLEGATAEVAALLRNPASTTLFWGFDAIAKAPEGEVEPHELVLRRLDQRSDWTVPYGVWVMDALRSLAEAVGALRVAYPEIDRRLEAIPESHGSDHILDAISSKLNYDIDFPNPFQGEIGVPSSRGIIGFRAVQALYQAWRLCCIAPNEKNISVLEIGAGLGRTAYYAYKMGLKNYTIVDIPLTNVAQAYFLGRTLGAEAVCLFGEDKTGIRIMPPAAVLGAKDHYNLVLNADSLTEMGRQTALAYCNMIAARSDRFLSINHEFNPFTVHEICAAAGLSAIGRAPYWMRAGYVEELFDPGDKA